MDRSAKPARFEIPGAAIFALIFSAVFLLHLALLRLPYFWDEAGYFVPAARDLLLTGDLIPHTTVTNAHPPLVMAWLALWWKLSGYTAAVTRTAMLLVSAFALFGVFRLARQVACTRVAVASTLLTALYPVWFAQSSLAHLDMAAAAFTIWGISSYLRENWWRASLWFALAALSKETAVAAPLALFAWELLRPLVLKREGSTFRRQSIVLLLSVLPLVSWFGYHYLRTGTVFGNPEFFRYNVAATANPLRIVLAGIQRLWQAFGYMNLYVLTVLAALCMMYAPVRGREANRIATRVQLAFGVVLAAYVAMLSLLGGAVLARYMLPVIPLVIIVCVSTVHRRVSWWRAAIGLTALAFIVGWFVNPYYRSAPEDSLNYVEFIKLHKQAAEITEQRYPHARVLTAWPASDELAKPWLGYVRQPIQVTRIENFSAPQVGLAAQAPATYDVALLFSTKLEPSSPLLSNLGWWRKIQERFFDYHRDLPPTAIAAMLGGRIVHQTFRNGQWVALVEFERIESAANLAARRPPTGEIQRISGID